ncbi:MAG TPA: TIGR04282 family arsenosugar biosynthesis glycosyltransferase [Rhodocyclaceae bacterium]|nr:TIGR04282 family arsenosugar biosynthesis glycosyltransferase [Rhodocyclaceae bacterium]
MHPASPEPPARIGVAILARAPVPGEAKTRLIPVLGADGAARLQRWLLQRTVAMALVADVGPVTLWCAGEPGHADFRLCRAFGAVSLQCQPAGDLGMRMLMALRQSATPAGTLVIGTDCPALDASQLRLAAQSLRGFDAVILPAEDGGYGLIGMKAASPEAFREIEWGTERVMQQTRERLVSAGLRWSEPGLLWDVDRPEDVARLFADFPDAREALAAEWEGA